MARNLSRGNQQLAARLASSHGPPPQRRAEAEEGERQYRARATRPKDRGVVTCGWCGTTVTVARVGRTPKWCSAACRHRAWQQRRAAASGRCAVEVVDRVVESVTVEKVVETVPVAVDVPQRLLCAQDYADMVTELTRRLDTGRISDRDLPVLDEPVGALLAALISRQRTSITRAY